jgi:hypothetical protein
VRNIATFYLHGFKIALLNNLTTKERLRGRLFREEVTKTHGTMMTKVDIGNISHLSKPAS